MDQQLAIARDHSVFEVLQDLQGVAIIVVVDDTMEIVRARAAVGLWLRCEKVVCTASYLGRACGVSDFIRAVLKHQL